MRGCFVTGTDTGVGKTVVAASIVAALRAGGTEVRALKPVITGLDERPPEDWPHDHELLARASGQAPGEVALAEYGPAVSPHLAQELTGRPLEPRALVEAIRRSVEGEGVAVVEGVGGLLVPLADEWDVRALALELRLPLVIAARPGLGTINHTLLTLEAARGAGLEVAGVVLTPWPDSPGTIERSNRETVARLGRVRIATLPQVARGASELLAAAGASLPLPEWLGLALTSSA